jgi:hypothetical protein
VPHNQGWYIFENGRFQGFKMKWLFWGGGVNS